MMKMFRVFIGPRLPSGRFYVKTKGGNNRANTLKYMARRNR